MTHSSARCRSTHSKDSQPESPNHCSPTKAELSVEKGCLMWGRRVIVPDFLKERVLQELHKEHLGITKMKAVAQNHVWWTGVDKDLDSLTKSCLACLAVKQAPASHPWIWPSRPWQRLHVDFAGPSYLVVVEAHSKWDKAIERPYYCLLPFVRLCSTFCINALSCQLSAE